MSQASTADPQEATAPGDPGVSRVRLHGTQLKVARRVTGVVGFLAIAELLSRTSVLDPQFVPPVSHVIKVAIQLCGEGTFLTQVGVTLAAWLIGLALSVLVGTLLGYVLGSNRFLYQSTTAVFDFIRPVPSVALIPFGILLFQQGMTLKLVLIVYAAAWPVLYNVITAVHSMDRLHRDTAAVFGIGRRRRVLRILVPSTLPHLATGIRIASPIALILTISVEMLGGSTDGLGVWILNASSGAGRADLVFAGTLIAGLLGALSNLVLAKAERRLLPWHPAYRPKEVK